MGLEGGGFLHCALVGDAERQVVILQVGMGGVVAGADKAADLKMRSRPQSFLREHPFQPQPRLAPRGHSVGLRNGLSAFVLHQHFDMILQVLAYARQVVDHGDAGLAQLVACADARDPEQVG